MWQSLFFCIYCVWLALQSYYCYKEHLLSYIVNKKVLKLNLINQPGVTAYMQGESKHCVSFVSLFAYTLLLFLISCSFLIEKSVINFPWCHPNVIYTHYLIKNKNIFPSAFLSSFSQHGVWRGHAWISCSGTSWQLFLVIHHMHFHWALSREIHGWQICISDFSYMQRPESIGYPCQSQSNSSQHIQKSNKMQLLHYVNVFTILG